MKEFGVGQDFWQHGNHNRVLHLFTLAHVVTRYVMQSRNSVFVIIFKGDGKRCDKKKVRRALSPCCMRGGQDCSYVWEAQGFHRDWFYIKQH